MWEIIEFARQQNILVQGRGSAANSAVCYCLGITAIDPIRYDLLFERFCPTLAMGIQILISTSNITVEKRLFVCVRPLWKAALGDGVCPSLFPWSGAVRDTARVLGFETAQATRLAGLVGRDRVLSVDAVQEEGFDARNPRVKALLKVVSAMRGLPRHRSTHVGALFSVPDLSSISLPSSRPLWRVEPLSNGIRMISIR